VPLRLQKLEELYLRAQQEVADLTQEQHPMLGPRNHAGLIMAGLHTNAGPLRDSCRSTGIHTSV
jgi:hypothetical protein